MAEVLFVSKPVAPPWNDSSKNLVRDVAANLRRHSPILMGREGQPNPIARGRIDPVYDKDVENRFAPGLRERFAVLRHLLWGRSGDLWHFFFAPNARSSAAGRFARRVRGVPTVHTACSMPMDDVPVKRLLFADVTVALSRASFERFVGDGIEPSALRRIPPCVPDLGEPTPERRSAFRKRHGLPESAAVWIYPGDLELGGGAEIAIEGFAAWGRPDAILLIACRDKTPAASDARAELAGLARRRGIDTQIRWVGETPQIHELLALSDFVLMVNRSHFGKMDYPLVSLESMSMARPVLVAEGTASAELAEGGGAVAVELSGEAVAAAVERLSGDRAAVDEIGRCGRALVTTELSPSRVAAEYESIYEELHG
jgi:phosphatidylinositol alpha-1,6-mannosyltransferase